MFAPMNLWLILYLIGLIQGRSIVRDSQEWPTPQPDPTIFEYPPTEKQELFLDESFLM
ncbi:uncharacterized protein LOC113565105 [Drosophila persimilis]|uniref:uncharacterized protein LOC113565105 n=1 Tax=Drosophila persimilis TaxID=7234 RepID=UPI0007086B36|nr:uncharacterized protein LOC113565105 [Drosophila persimilis]